MPKKHFHDELKLLERMIINMGLAVEEALNQSVTALFEYSLPLAEEVIKNDRRINRLEIEIDDKAHSLLVLEQPMANDMRFITMAMKINTVLERIGDHAVNIAEQAIYLIEEVSVSIKTQLPDMAKAVQTMLGDVIDAFLNLDIEKTRELLKSDDLIDTYNRNLYNQLIPCMEDKRENVRAGIVLLTVGHDLERIADLVNNIAEDILYITQAKEVRHRFEAPDPIA